MRIKLLIIGFVLLSSCNQSNQKELELREREIAIKERELGINSPDTTFKTNTDNSLLNDASKSTNNKSNTSVTTAEKIELSKEDKWEMFWTNFKSAIENKEKAKVKSLTSNDFFDGGGGSTILEWLESSVYSSNEDFDNFKIVLYSGVKTFRSPDGKAYKATGNGEMGNLYFDYKNGKWLFGGVVGD